MQKISTKKLLQILTECKGISGNTFIGGDFLTIPVLKGGKGNDMQGRVQKITIGASLQIFQNKRVNGYESAVKRRLEAEGKNPDTFELKPRQWGQRLENCPIVEHTNKAGEQNFYLEVIYLKSGKTNYLFDGKPIEKNAIIGLEDKEEGFQGGLENSVIIRSYKLDSIVRLTVAGETYIIED